MKAIINPAILLAELKKIQPVINKNHIIPIASGLLMSFSKNKLALTGTNLNTSVVCLIDCECPNPFDLVIEFSDLLDVCGKLNSPMTIELVGSQIIISSGSVTLKYAVLGEKEHFPVVENYEPLITTTVGGNFFFALKNANACRFKDESVTNMNAACIDFQKDKTTIVGVDNRMGYIQYFDIKNDVELQVMVSPDFVNICKTFQNTEINVSEKFISATYGKTKIISRLQDSKFVSYKFIIPAEINYTLTIGVNNLKNVLSIGLLTSYESTKLCGIYFSKTKITVSSSNTELNKQSSSFLDIENGVPIESIGVNAGQLLQLLSLLVSEEVKLSINNREKTIYIKPTDDNSILMLVQPCAL